MDYDYLYAARETADGGYILDENTNGPNATQTYGSLIKTNATGDTLWTRSYIVQGNNYNAGLEAKQSMDGGYFMMGFTAASFGQEEMLLVKTDSLGHSACSEQQKSIVVTNPATREFNRGTTVTSPVITVTALPTVGINRGAGTTVCSSVGLPENNIEFTFALFPNPVVQSDRNFSVLVSNASETISTLKIVNLLGEELLTQSIPTNKKENIRMPDVAAGIYFVTITDGVNQRVKKLIIQ
jgi:hypothetical protein